MQSNAGSGEVLVTGGAGFIGRWVVKLLLDKGYRVVVLDNLSSGSRANIVEFEGNGAFSFVEGETADQGLVDRLFKEHGFQGCFHLAFHARTRDSIDDPEKVFRSDVQGTFHILEACRAYRTRLLFMSTNRVYAPSSDWAGITELHPTRAITPSEAYRIAGETMALSYWRTYGLPVTVVRPFDTYGPYQRFDEEGNVEAVFIRRKMEGKPLRVHGDGSQTRDLMEVSDCADFVVQAGTSEKTVGEILNVGSGRDVTINQLAEMISGGEVPIEHVSRGHPEKGLEKLLCNYRKARDLMGWRPKIKIERGIRQLQAWVKEHGLGSRE